MCLEGLVRPESMHANSDSQHSNVIHAKCKENGFGMTLKGLNEAIKCKNVKGNYLEDHGKVQIDFICSFVVLYLLCDLV